MESCKRRLAGATSPQVYRWKDATGLAVSTLSHVLGQDSLSKLTHERYRGFANLQAWGQIDQLHIKPRIHFEQLWE